MSFLKTVITISPRPHQISTREVRPPSVAALARPIAGLAAALLVTAGGSAHANPKPLPYTYFANVQAPGAFEIEAITDLSPVRVARVSDTGTDAVTSLRLGLQTELEVGLCEGLEFGWYFVFGQDASAGDTALVFDGVKQRLRWQLAPTDAWPIDVALYFEIAELHDELELEAKIILSKRLGAWRFAVNLWAEEEYNFQDDHWETVYNPTAGVLYDFSPRLSLGLEYWLRGTIEDEDEGGAGEGPVHYLGPTLFAATAGPWFSLGAYVRLDGLGDRQAVGDEHGKLWFRAVVGFDI